MLRLKASIIILGSRELQPRKLPVGLTKWFSLLKSVVQIIVILVGYITFALNLARVAVLTDDVSRRIDCKHFLADSQCKTHLNFKKILCTYSMVDYFPLCFPLLQSPPSKANQWRNWRISKSRPGPSCIVTRQTSRYPCTELGLFHALDLAYSAPSMHSMNNLFYVNILKSYYFLLNAELITFLHLIYKKTVLEWCY